MSARWIWAVVVAVGCGKKSGGAADDCQQFVDKSRPVLTDLAKAAGKSMPPAMLDEMLADCRSGKSKGQDQGMFDCVVAAADRNAVETCWRDAFADYANAGRRVAAGAGGGGGGGGGGGPAESEAKLVAAKLGKLAKVYYMEQAKYPEGTAQTPACCTMDPPGTCKPDPAMWSGVWQTLDFSIDEPYRVQLSYQGTATAFTATAAVDADCDTEPFTVTVTGTVVAGSPVVTTAEAGQD